MNAPQRSLLAVAISLAIAAVPAHAALERMGPINKASSVGGYPSWFQDKSGITVEFCDLKNQTELNGGWCVLIPPGLSYPEVFPSSYFDEHFYYIADNGLKDAAPPGGFKARLVVAIEAAFANGAVVDGDQMTFGRHRVFIPNLPWDGDYRVITPFSDVSYLDQKAGDRIFETSDVGPACVNTFECTLETVIGPFLLPSPVAGGAEVPPMPALASAPVGTDPYYDALVAAGLPTANPGTGKSYIADPARIGPVTGSPLPNFIDSDGNSRSHNTFRIEVRAPAPNHDGAILYVIDGETNFTTAGRLMNSAIPGKVIVKRASYRADSAGAVTDLDVFASASPTVQSRIPGQPLPAPVLPVLSFFDAPCVGALTQNPLTGTLSVNPPPYTSPGGAEHQMTAGGIDFWGQSQPGALPSHICVQDATARNAAGQTVPAYYLKNVTDLVTMGPASFDANGTLKVNAASSDPTAVLTLAGYGPAPVDSPGVMDGRGAGTGLDLAGGSATITSLRAPPARAQVVSSKGGSARQPVETSHGAVTVKGVPVAVSDFVTMDEDCSAVAATVCAAGQGVVLDLLANDTVAINGDAKSIRLVVTENMGVVTVDALAPRLGIASIVDGVLTYTPNPNAFGTDSITYTVTVDGKISNVATVNITIRPVNDAPVAVNSSTAGVLGKPGAFNLIANATDPDGNADVKDAVITGWPLAGLGPQPVPVGGVITFTPDVSGATTFTYQVRDAAGALSDNIATATVNVAATETIAITKSRFVGAGKVGGTASTRWIVTGTDTIKQGQTLSIVYNNGQLKSSTVPCDGTATQPKCVVATVVVDSTGAYSLDRVSVQGGPLDPNDTNTWGTKPTVVNVFSSAPMLGGSKTNAIEFK